MPFYQLDHLAVDNPSSRPIWDAVMADFACASQSASSRVGDSARYLKFEA